MARCIVLVLDSAGIGALPDAQAYGDANTVNTISNTASYVGGLQLRNFEAIGLGALVPVRGVGSTPLRPVRIARLAEQSAGKDTITGHWEMAGIVTQIAFPTFPNGFPVEVVSGFAQIIGKMPLGNVAASGTEIIAMLGEEHVRTGRPILYTSADSVFQVAAHEDVVPVEMLHYWCEEARKMLVQPFEVNRVIARPFVGNPGEFVRTPNRRDYAVTPPHNIIDQLASASVPVHAVGKIHDIYSGRGISSSSRVADNEETMTVTVDLMDQVDHGFIFSNFNDFDTKFGHRRDVRGYANALQRFDMRLQEVFERLRADDVVIITADHGCDPTAPGSDHTREYVPYLSFGAVESVDLGVVQGLSAVGETVLATLLPT